MTARTAAIEALDDRQRLDIVQYMTLWMRRRQPESEEAAPAEEAEILNRLFQDRGLAPLQFSTEALLDEATVGEVAGRLLRTIAEADDPELLAELDHWLASPPRAGTMVLAEMVVVPIVLSACIAFLQTEVRWEKGRITVIKRPTSTKDFYEALKVMFP
jgi:hypothetical protein